MSLTMEHRSPALVKWLEAGLRREAGALPGEDNGLAMSPVTGHSHAAASPLEPGEAPPIAWKLQREVVLLAGWGRAILLQLAHPLVAQGVADHSGFAGERWGRVGRLRRTLEAMLSLTFGAPAESARAAAGINRIHDRVHGRLIEAAGALPTGARYSAHDPALLAWVHATLVDTFLLTYERFVAPLTPAERDRYCREATAVAPLLGIPPHLLPCDTPALAEYMERMLASGEIVVTDTARSLAREVLSLGLPRPTQPLVSLARLPAVGLLPRSIREAYGFAWTKGQERILNGLAVATRHTLPVLPPFLRCWPAARRAMRRARAVGPAAD